MFKKLSLFFSILGFAVLVFSGTKVHATDTSKLSICSYDVSQNQSCKGGQFRIYCDDFGTEELYYGGNNYNLYNGTEIRVKAYPDNGYLFVGWKKGEYVGGDNQAAKPYFTPASELSNETEYTFVLTEDTVICPVFEQQHIVNFIDIGNVWTWLDSVHEIPFTGEINPNEEGLDQYISLDEERWVCEDGTMISSKKPGMVKLGKKYSYEATIRAKDGYVFNTSEIRFVYGGTEYQDIKVEYEPGNEAVTISGFIPKQIVAPMSIQGAQVNGVENKLYTGKPLTQNPTVLLDGVTLKQDVDYKITYSDNTNYGTATMTIEGIGNYGGIISKKFNIYGVKDYPNVKRPAKTSIKKATRKGKKLSLKFSKAKNATGYEIRIYKSKKDAKKNKNAILKKTVKTVKCSISSKKIKKNKKLYIRVRAIAKGGNCIRISAWTKVKVVK